LKLLLDTHALIWWVEGSKRLSSVAREAIANEEVLVSAASAWEIATKFRLGKLPSSERMARNFSREILAEGFAELPVAARHASHAGLLEVPHKDPFDRMLIAQAQVEGLPLISNEQLFDDFGVKRIW
jgi:PIN domain nuclease of toxin-antitoxin system